MKKKSFIFFVVCVFAVASCMSVVSNVNAATKEQIEDAIVKGLEWLAAQQQADGSWWYYPYPVVTYDPAVTALVLLKFVERAKELGLDPFGADYPYAANVIAGFDYIFGNAAVDAGGRAYIKEYETYNTGTAMMAIAATNAPTREITVGPLTGMTYQQALQGMLDWMAYYQQKSTPFSCAQGGWAYYANMYGQPWADQSNTGYATLGVGFATAPTPKGFGLTMPAGLLTNLDAYITAVQDPINGDPYNYDGGSWYEPCTPYMWVNILKTGNLLYEMALVGDELADARVQNAISYIQNHWNDMGQQPEYTNTSLGWKDSYQAMFTLMKGLEAFAITEVTVGGSEIDWFDEVSDVIVANQNDDGSWKWINMSIYDGEQSANLRAAWAMLTLERVVPTVVKKVFIDIKPGSCPNPLNVKSKGVLPVAVLGVEDFDVSTIDPATIRLSREEVEGEVAPLRWSYEDVATPFEGELCGCHALYGDGYTDLTLKFDTQELVSTLKLEEVIGNTLPLTLTGNLKEEFGGTPIKGQDCIWVLK